MDNAQLLIILSIIFAAIILAIVIVVLKSDGETNINVDLPKGKLGIKRNDLQTD